MGRSPPRPPCQITIIWTLWHFPKNSFHQTCLYWSWLRAVSVWADFFPGAFVKSNQEQLFNITLLEARLTVWPNNEGNKALSWNTWRMKCPEEGLKKFSCIPENLEGNTYELGPASSQEGPLRKTASHLWLTLRLCAIPKWRQTALSPACLSI